MANDNLKMQSTIVGQIFLKPVGRPCHKKCSMQYRSSDSYDKCQKKLIKI